MPPQNKTSSFSLDILKQGLGVGVVTSSPAGIDCGNDCNEMYADGTSVTLTASTGADAEFTGWGGDCTGLQTTCTLNIGSNKQVVASFNQIPQITYYTLGVTRSGSGSGSIISSPTGINCGSDCSEMYVSGTSVTLAASASTNSVFNSWSGACSGTGDCLLVMNADKNINAQFDSQGVTDTIPPSIDIITPKDGYEIPNRGTIKILINASDANGIKETKIYINNVVVKTCTSSSCQQSIKSSNFNVGTYTITGEATDKALNVNSKSIVIIKNLSPRNIEPDADANFLTDFVEKVKNRFSSFFWKIWAIQQV